MRAKARSQERSEGLNAQLSMMRARVESSVAKPAVVLVTSAWSGDGKSVTAYALAHSLTNAGYSVALVDAARNAFPADSGEPRATRPTLVRFSQRRSLRSEHLEAFATELRAAHEFAIVDTDALLKSDVAMALVKVADAALIAVRLGRVPTDADELFLKMLRHTQIPLIGVVAVSAEAVEDFGRRRSAGTLPSGWHPPEAGTAPLWQQAVHAVAAS
jgi:Mrp family chromosome partitioning ATPase